MSQPRVVKLGILGLGSAWKSRLGPAINKLKDRVRIVAVYDPAPGLARSVAESEGATAYYGVRAMLDAPMDALLVSDFGWQGEWVLTTAVAAGLTLFIGFDCRLSSSVRKQLRSNETSTGTMIIPEQRFRYQPSLLRLRELMASRLGDVREVQVHLARSQAVIDATVTLADLMGWCRVTFNLIADRASVEVLDDPDALPGDVRLTVPTKVHPGLRIRIRTGIPVLDEQTGTPREKTGELGESTDEPEAFVTVICESGCVELFDSRQLRWNTGGGWSRETLGNDRSAADVAVDLFARRAVGGLIPVPDLSDFDYAEHLTQRVNDVIKKTAPDTGD